jgi:hypothetical protein
VCEQASGQVLIITEAKAGIKATRVEQLDDMLSKCDVVTIVSVIVYHPTAES